MKFRASRSLQILEGAREISSRLFSFKSMPRARNIKPSFFVNEDLVELPFSTRLLFIGLWTLADREGRLADKPKQIRLALFPADDVDVDKGLTELTAAGFIERYETKGEKYIQILNFTKHQSPHIKEAASTIPAPVKHRASTRRAALNPESKTESTVLNPHTDSGVRVFPKLVNAISTETQDYVDTVLDCIRSELGVNQLPNESSWLDEIERARLNGFTTNHCLEVFRLMRAQKWRTGPIRPGTWAENLPNLEKLREEKDGKNRNGYNKRTDADVLAESAEFYKNFNG